MPHAAIDIHTHILPPGWDDWAARYGVQGWPACRLHDACNATIYLGEKEFRRVDERSFSPARRIADMDAEGIGLQIMNRMGGGGGPMAPDPIAGALSDPAKRRAAAQIIGQAYVVAHNLATTNRDGLDRIAEVLMEKKEIFGDELMDLLDSVGIRIPDLDYGDEATWPPPFFTISAPERQRPKEIEKA